MSPETSTSLPSSTEVALDSLRAQVDAFDRQLNSSTTQTSSIVRYRNERLLDALGHLRAAVQGGPGARHSLWAGLQPVAETLEKQLGGRAATRPDALDAQRSRIELAATALHAELVDTFARAGRHLDATTLRALRRFQHALHALDAELRIAAACRRLTAGCRGRALADRRRELTGQLRSLTALIDERRAEIAAHRERSATSWRAIDKRLRAEVEAVGMAFERLLSSGPGTRVPLTRNPLARAGKAARRERT